MFPFRLPSFSNWCGEKFIEIASRGKLPMIVGGTGLYIQSVLYDYRFSDISGDAKYRRELELLAEREGAGVLYKMLEELDPETAGKIHPHNVRRVIWALEIYHFSGKMMHEYRKEQKEEMLYDAALVGLTLEREKLYARINQRVDKMIEQGLIAEVEKLLANICAVPSQSRRSATKSCMIILMGS